MTAAKHASSSQNSLSGTKKLAVSYVQTDSLEPYARNSRTHSDRQVEQIADAHRAQAAA